MSKFRSLRDWIRDLSIFRRLHQRKLINGVLTEEFCHHLRRLKVGDIVFDLGANVGHISEILARTGATCYSFEPNKKAYNRLSKAARRRKNIIALNSAAGTRNGEEKLYHHENSNDLDRDYSQASSLLVNKPNVSSDLFEVVSILNLAEFIVNNKLNVELMKVDIEGFEIDLINHLIDTGAIEHINKLYVETHEKKFTDLEEATLKLKERILLVGLNDRFSFEWH